MGCCVLGEAALVVLRLAGGVSVVPRAEITAYCGLPYVLCM